MSGGCDAAVVEPMPVMPSGDDRPGRSVRWPVALIVHPEVVQRLRMAEALEAEGYRVIACPGPTTSTRCPGLHGRDATRCPRIPDTVELVIVDQESARTRLLDAYQAWCPDASVTVLG